MTNEEMKKQICEHCLVPRYRAVHEDVKCRNKNGRHKWVTKKDVWEGTCSLCGDSDFRHIEDRKLLNEANVCSYCNYLKENIKESRHGIFLDYKWLPFKRIVF